MTALLLVSGGPGISVQDRGRFGLRRYGVSTAGAMDFQALAAANALVGNPADTAAIEIALTRAAFRVSGGPVLVAAFGAGAALWLGSSPVAPATSALAGDGKILTIGPATEGLYSYLAIAGGVQGPEDLGSRSYHRRSGIGGPPLTLGAALTCLPAPAGAQPCCLSGLPILQPGPIRVLPGPQIGSFSQDTADGLIAATYRLSARSDRMALRLEGPPVVAREGHDIVSDGVVPGSIQIPGDGQPLILMRDCQTTGGYPKIATVITADLDRLAQIRPGQEIRFRQVTLDEARTAATETAAAVATLRSCVIPAADPLKALFSANLIGGVTTGDYL